MTLLVKTSRRTLVMLLHMYLLLFPVAAAAATRPWSGRREGFRGTLAFIKDFVEHYNFKFVNIYTALKERNTLTKLFCSDVSLRMVKVSQWTLNQTQLDKSIQLSIVWAIGDQLDLLAKVIKPRNYMWWLVLVDYKWSFRTLYLPVNNKVMLVEGVDVGGALVALNSSIGSERVAKLLLQEAYTTAQHIPHKVTTVGSWVEGDKGDARALRTPTLDVYERRTDLLGLHLRCVSEEWAPAIIVGPVNADGTIEVRGWIGSVWKDLQKRLNFTSTCRPSTDGEWGSLRDGVWSGMVGDVLRGLADVVVGPMDNTLSRSRVIDFPLQITNTKYTLVIRRGKSVGVSWESYTRGFGWWCWMVVVGLVVLEAYLLVVVVRSSPLERNNEVSFSDALIFTLGSCTQQGSWLNFTSLSSRIILLTAFFTGVLLYAFYTSALFTSFTLFSNTMPFSNLEGLLADGSYRFGFVRGLSIENYFRDSYNELYWRVWQKLVLPDPSSLVSGDSEGLARARAENYVYMMDKDVFIHMNQGLCDLRGLPTAYFYFPAGMGFQKGSPLVEIFSKAILEFWSSGLLNKYHHMWNQHTTACDDLGLTALSLSHVFTSFLLIIVGIVLSLFLLLIEKIVGRLKTHFLTKSRITIVKSRPRASKH